MHSTVARRLLLTVTLLQAPIPNLVRVGDIGRNLTNQQLWDLSQGLANGLSPWLAVGELCQTGELVTLFLAPEKTVGPMRRGNAVVLLRGNPRGTHPYAQVAIPGRDFGDVKNLNDPNRPFRIEGEYNDTDLTGIVAAVRSSVVGSFPIRSISRTNDSVQVMLSETCTKGSSVRVQKRENRWIVVSTGLWVA